MKLTLIVLFVLIVGRASAQSKPADNQAMASNTTNQQNAIAAISTHAYAPKVLFTYRGGLATHHDTATYLRDTTIYKRTFSLIQLPGGEVRRVPVNSIKPLNGNSSAVYKELASSH